MFYLSVLCCPQELSSLGLPSIFYDSNRNQELDIILTLNNMYDLLQLHHFAVGSVDEHEVAQLKVSTSTASISAAPESKLGFKNVCE